MILTALVFLALGSVIGLIGGYFGIGGGVLLVPILAEYYTSRNFTIDQVATTSFSTALFMAMFLTGSAAIKQIRQKNIMLSLVLWLAIGGIVGAQFGSFSGSTFKGGVLIKAFGALLAMIAIHVSFFKKKSVETQPHEVHPMLLLGIGFLTGAVAATFGLGGGVLLIPALLLMNLPSGRIAGTSSLVACITAISGGIGYQFYGSLRSIELPGFVGVLDLQVAIPTAIGAMILAPTGAKWNKQFGGKVYHKAFSVLLFIVGFRMLLR